MTQEFKSLYEVINAIGFVETVNKLNKLYDYKDNCDIIQKELNKKYVIEPDRIWIIDEHNDLHDLYIEDEM